MPEARHPGLNEPLSNTSSDKLRQPAGLEWRQIALWRGDRCLQKNLNGQLQPGHAITLRGPNGCGKTTLIRTLCGLSEPELGDVLWGGAAIRSQRTEFHAQLAYAGHRAGLKDELTARENLRFAAQMGCSDATALNEIITALQLDACADLPVAHLSAGQQRRVTLARVLSSSKPLWILDEPFTHLDQTGRAWLSQRFNQHLQESGLLLLAAHQDTGLDANRETIIELSDGAQ